MGLSHVWPWAKCEVSSLPVGPAVCPSVPEELGTRARILPLVPPGPPTPAISYLASHLPTWWQPHRCTRLTLTRRRAPGLRQVTFNPCGHQSGAVCCMGTPAGGDWHRT